MRNYYKITIGIVLVIVITFVLHAQTDTSYKINDSINASLLKEYSKKIAEIENQRIADSLRKEDLEEQLSSLKTTDNLKKQDLERQLQEINDKEAKRIAMKKSRIDSMRATAKAYPVIGFFKDTIMLIYNKLGSFTAKERAKALSLRIKKLADIPSFNDSSLKLVPNDIIIDIICDETIIMSITENDAIWANLSKMELAEKYKRIITDKVLEYKSETRFSVLAKSIGLALFAIIITGFIIFYLIKLFKWITSKIKDQEGKRINGLKIRDYTLLDSKQQVKVLLLISNTMKWVLIFILIYIALPILFGIFPWTKNLANILFSYIINPIKIVANGLWNYLPKLITIIVIVIVFRYILKGLRYIKKEIYLGKLKIKGFYPDWANPTFQIISVLLYAFMFVVIFPYLPGSDSPVFQGVSVFLGILFTFGSTGSLSNIMAGIVLTYMRAFKIGDRVKIGEITGDIIEKSLLVTRIRTTKNEIISIPNANIMNSHTINFSSEAIKKGLILHTTVTIGYDVPWKNMHQALIDAALRTEFLLADPKPFVLQTSLDDFYVSYQINAYTKEPNKQATIYSRLHENIQDCCNEVGIEILSPHYRSNRDGNSMGVPTEYLPKDYVAPSFNVKIKNGKDN